ncbi:MULTISPECIES: phage tail spike protein [unclassified Leuconostoc]|uniref:phage tail spike protein n=1 Tax=unclassified Leuconostoc TaxID=2685106 RepID=UPI00190514A9|nr:MULTISPECIES: phage tail spike protein [unclassified Leuconostoc]MBK0040278.1 phage tail protein [Leuconostoc sp. S51]MBK0052325.1 phage tail protein [Leuconostoc sp. S50]
MTPILYEKDEIDFTSQGLGSLVEIYDVDVEEQRNGLLQLTASYPVSGVRYDDISVGRIILAKPNQRDDVHAFRIVSTELDISGYAVTIEADSITYDLTHNLVKHLNASGNGQAFMTALKNAVVNPSIFAFYSDIATSSTTSINYVNPMEAIMGTTGSFLQIWGGELKRENRRVAMFNRRGRDNVSTFRLGKNISGLKYSVDISSLVTRIIPTKSVQNDDQTTTTLEGTPVDSQYINNYEQVYTLPLEFTDDTIKTVADLNAAAKGWFTQSANTGRDKPTVTIDIDVLSLQDSADYQDKFKNLESVSLTDTVTVYVPEYGVNVTAIVNELHYDPILDRVTKMTVGTAKQSFADSSRTQLSDLQDKIISVQNQADAAAVSANGKSTNYYGSVEPSHPQEGDTWFWVNGDKSGVKVFVNGDWVDPVDSDTQEKIAAGVTEAVAQANAHTDEVEQGLSTDIATAKSQAASQANAAEANAKSAATSQFTQAQNALAAAKTALQKDIDKNTGDISQAQLDITANEKAIGAKVSQTDYDAETKSLTTQIGQAQLTADNAALSLSNYQKDADGRITANTTDIEANTKAIKAKVAQSDYDANNTVLTSRLTAVKATADGAEIAVSKLEDAVNNLGQVNQLFNTEFTPDYQSWTGYDATFVNDIYTKTYKGSNVVAINSKDTGYHYLWQFVPVIAGTVISFSAYMHYNPTTPDNSTVFFRYQLVFYNDSNTSVGQTFGTANYQSLAWVLQKSENIAVPTGATKVRVTFYSRGAGYAAIAQPMLVFASTVGTYVQGNYNNNAALAQVKITADSISNFVRDSSGNISSDFQTALSKTSIITGSTLATSIQKQTATQITSALTDNNGKIISLINQDSSGVQIAGKNIVLDGNTTVTGDFYAKGGNFKNLNASNLTVGTLNGSQVNITNINANNIVSGAISGANLNINLNTGSVVFQKGRINSSDYTTDINIDQGYISTANGVTRALLTQGKLQLIDPTLFSPQTNPYLEISNNSSLFNGMSALIKARDSLTVSINGYDDRGYDTPISTEKFVGLSIGKYNGNLMPTKIGGAEQGVIISGGKQYNDIVGTSEPYIYIGSDSKGASPNGDRISLQAKAVHIPSAYNVTWSQSANVYIASDGSLYRASSAKKYKQDIKHNVPLSDSKKLLEIPLSTWIDKRQYREKNDETRYFGMIAEDLRDAGLEYLVQYGEDNEVEGINYDRVALLLIPLVKELKERIEELESEGK